MSQMSTKRKRIVSQPRTWERGRGSSNGAVCLVVPNLIPRRRRAATANGMADASLERRWPKLRKCFRNREVRFAALAVYFITVQGDSPSKTLALVDFDFQSSAVL